MKKKPQRYWRYKSIPVKHHGVKLSFTITQPIKVKNSRYSILDIKEMTSIYLPRTVYNQILRKLKVDSLLGDSDQITVEQVYNAAREYNSRFQVILESFDII